MQMVFVAVALFLGVYVFHLITLVNIHTVRSYPKMSPLSFGSFPQEIFWDC